MPYFDKIVMVGSSILLLYDKEDPANNKVKIIDFANSYNYTSEISEYNKEFVESYRMGIHNLIYDLKHLLVSKEDITKERKYLKKKSRKRVSYRRATSNRRK